MNRNFKYFGLYWLISVALFNAVVFLVPRTILGLDRFSMPVFWIAYDICMVALGGQLILGYFALRDDKKEKIFLRLPLFRVGYVTVALSIVLAWPFLLIPVTPAWLGAVFCFAFAFYFALATLRAAAAAENVEAVGEAVAVKTAFVRSLTANAQALAGYAKDEQAKTAVRRVYEALRYTDPMSDAALNDIEEEIFDAYNRFDEAVRTGDSAAVALLSDKVVLLVGERAAKCKLLKR